MIDCARHRGHCVVEYETIAQLLTGHFKVIGFDYPGHGRSDDPERELGVPEFCDVAIAVLDTPMTRDLPIDAEGEFFIEGLKARSRPYDAHFAVLRWDRDPVMARMRKPALLIHGEHDDFAEAPEQMAAQIEGSRPKLATNSPQKGFQTA